LQKGKIRSGVLSLGKGTADHPALVADLKILSCHFFIGGSDVIRQRLVTQCKGQTKRADLKKFQNSKPELTASGNGKEQPASLVDLPFMRYVQLFICHEKETYTLRVG